MSGGTYPTQSILAAARWRRIAPHRPHARTLTSPTHDTLAGDLPRAGIGRRLGLTATAVQHGRTQRGATWVFCRTVRRFEHSERLCAIRCGLTPPSRRFGSIVVSCWSHRLKLVDGALTYQDQLSRWDPQSPGRKLLCDHLTQALEHQLPLRLVIATTDQPDVVDRGQDTRGIFKTFHTRHDIVGRVIRFDSDAYALQFRRSDASDRRTEDRP